VGCLLIVLAAFFPRVALLALWLFTNEVDRAYDTFIVPLLGLFFLPLTTLVYALLWVPAGGVDGIDWLWVGIALVLDLSSWGGGARSRRD
jgi:hypothetical protein